MSLSALHHALRDKDADKALRLASRRRSVPLRYAARIVCLLADENHPLYDAAARRFLVRVAEELEPPLEQVWRLANCLRFVRHHFHQHEARMGLQEVIGQLHRHEPIEVDFNGGCD